MPSSWHDSAKELFLDDPASVMDLVAELSGDPLGKGVLARTEPPNFNDRPSTDFEADAVIVAGPIHDPVRAVIVEIQRQPSETKLRQFPRYAVALWLLLKCPVDLLVVCPDDQTAGWYARSIETNLRGYTHYPIAMRPSQVPVITDPVEATRHPTLAALSVAYHGTNPAVCQAFAEALQHLAPEKAAKYHEYAFDLSPLAVQKILEEIMASTAWPVHSPFAKEHFSRGKAEGKAEGKVEGRAEGKAEGKAEGEANAVLLVLKARGLEVFEADRDHILACTDLGQLQTWIMRAATAEKTSDLFR
jgi:hypothetical protein